MPKLGAEPIRRAALVKAAIAEVGQAGSLDVSVAQIARTAGMSSALAHHYFGSKDQMLIAAMRHVLSVYSAGVAAALRGACAAPQGGADAARARLNAVIAASFAADSFQRDSISAWLHFYVLAQTSPDAARLLRVYHARLRSNLLVALRPLAAHRAARIAQTLGAMIDGVYLRAALAPQAMDPAGAVDLLQGYVDEVLS